MTGAEQRAQPMPPGCDIYDEWLALAALDNPLGPIDTATAEHLGSGCERCHDLLRELRETVHQLPYSLIPAPPPRRGPGID